MAGPSTVEQVVLLALFVLPGISYQFVRERSRGLVPGERDVAERVLRAFVTSVVTLTACALVAGPFLSSFITPVDGVWFAGATTRPRQAALLVFTLLVLVPALVATVVNRSVYRPPARWKPDYPGQSAWHGAFTRRRAGLVRARLKNGQWVAGWYGPRSRASGQPGQAELYLSSQYEVGPDGHVGRRVNYTDGVYINLVDVDFIEIFRPPSQPRPKEEIA